MCKKPTDPVFTEIQDTHNSHVRGPLFSGQPWSAGFLPYIEKKRSLFLPENKWQT
jgi:hypothetical protein